ncbi:LacI family transcriptional regulator [Arcanobacterium wilhelmae]|uniref:LacI family transcriptional regulator n=1 Tax=Arcanobacterium wilhelmae TaxID=1803177 RepID=A0ABT9NC92_9ACTO|nr:LacI family DNA-binding transcriptional regulator [Arcanobacterium wilhelmae]MDP9801341.1 LacI family transcriptional regulator [Arcanobacterium wilhelmae]
MSGDKRATIYDVAKVAGVSPSTVSRAFSNPARVSSDTTAKIFEAARALGFRQSGSSYPAHSHHSSILCFVMADVTNPVFATMLEGFQRAAHQANYGVVVINSDENVAIEEKTIRKMLPQVDGIALAGSRLTPAAILAIEKTKPLVLLNRFLDGHTCVLPDTSGGIGDVCRYLAELGHKELLYLSGPKLSWANGMRWRSAQEKCHEYGITLRHTPNLSPRLLGGIDGAHLWMQHPTTAVLAYNDMMAMGFIKEVMSEGYSVPGDVSVVGIDDSVMSSFSDPTISSLSSGSYDVGRKAAKSLIWQIANHANRERKTLIVPMEFAERESTGEAKK